jgi:hypothetical protein
VVARRARVFGENAKNNAYNDLNIVPNRAKMHAPSAFLFMEPGVFSLFIGSN